MIFLALFIVPPISLISLTALWWSWSPATIWRRTTIAACVLGGSFLLSLALTNGFMWHDTLGLWIHFAIQLIAATSLPMMLRVFCGCLLQRTNVVVNASFKQHQFSIVDLLMLTFVCAVALQLSRFLHLPPFVLLAQISMFNFAIWVSLIPLAFIILRDRFGDWTFLIALIYVVLASIGTMTMFSLLTPIGEDFVIVFSVISLFNFLNAAVLGFMSSLGYRLTLAKDFPKIQQHKPQITSLVSPESASPEDRSLANRE
jgi:hypothetical protein